MYFYSESTHPSSLGQFWLISDNCKISPFSLIFTSEKLVIVEQIRTGSSYQYLLCESICWLQKGSGSNITIWCEIHRQFKNKCHFAKPCNLVPYNLAKSSDLNNKIFSNKVWCILDVSVNYLSSKQATFRGLHSILQDENKVLNWKQIHKK